MMSFGDRIVRDGDVDGVGDDGRGQGQMGEGCKRFDRTRADRGWWMRAHMSGAGDGLGEETGGGRPGCKLFGLGAGLRSIGPQWT